MPWQRGTFRRNSSSHRHIASLTCGALSLRSCFTSTHPPQPAAPDSEAGSVPTPDKGKLQQTGCFNTTTSLGDTGTIYIGLKSRDLSLPCSHPAKAVPAAEPLSDSPGEPRPLRFVPEPVLTNTGAVPTAEPRACLLPHSVRPATGQRWARSGEGMELGQLGKGHSTPDDDVPGNNSSGKGGGRRMLCLWCLPSQVTITHAEALLSRKQAGHLPATGKQSINSLLLCLHAQLCFT